MMKKYSTLILLSLLTISCASKKEEPVKTQFDFDAQSKDGVPLWLYSPAKVCPKEFLCASNEGVSMELADLNAKKSLAAILEVSIDSNFELKKTGMTSVQANDLIETVNNDVASRTKQVLNGVKVQSRFQKDGAHYSFVTLDKRESAKIIWQELRGTDSRLSSLFSEQKRVYVNELLRLYNKRNALSEQLVVLKGKGKKSPVSFKDIWGLKSSDLNKALGLQVLASLPKGLRSNIEQSLTSVGYEFHRNNAEQYITISFKQNEEHLNVKGFRKFTFHTTINAYSKMGDKKGVIHLESTATGRSKADALSQALVITKKELDKKLYQLNLK